MSRPAAASPLDPAAAPGKAVDLGLLRRLWPFIRPHRRLLLRGFLFLLVGSGCRLALPFLVKVGIDDYLTPGVLDGVGWLLAAFAVLGLVEMGARRLQMIAVDTAGQDALLDLRSRLFGHLQRLPASYYDRTPTGKVLGRLTTDVEALNELFSSGVVTVLGDLVFLAASLAILLALDWQLTLATLMIVPPLGAVTMFVRGRVRRAYQQMRSQLSAMNAFLHEQVSGMPVNQMFLREARVAAQYEVTNDGVRVAQLRTVRWESLLSAAVEMLGSFTVALILWFGGGHALGALDGGPEAAGAALTLGTLFAFIEYMQRFFAPLNDLSMKYAVLQNATTASRRIFDLLDVDEALPEPADPPLLPPARGEIVFDRVSFGYGGEQVLREISFRVAPGERVALVGATGAGKTTVLKLLTRLYDPTHGAIRLDGVDLRDHALRDLRSRIALVPQDVFLFEGTILENIRLGKPEIGDEQAQAAADRLHLDEFVARFPRGYREPVRERGKNLSAGEKQLLSFARVLAASPPVLTLDEATSNVDSHTEHVLQQAVHELMQGRTSIAVAHRLSTVRDVDRILVFHQGRLVEEGDHDALMTRRGVYWRLVELQGLHG
ncbi:MAG: ABC transporter ATP-binding protein [Planctomycetes bacterium]|nr:ABC transporter ATP-binding protein [Planctomycetota bacterium]